MPRLPHDPKFDSTRDFLSKGHRFIGERCDRLGADGFHGRLMLTPVTCPRGAEAAELVYREDAFRRRGAMPRTTLALLQGSRSVQILDGPAHRHRRALFLPLTAPEGASGGRPSATMLQQLGAQIKAMLEVERTFRARRTLRTLEFSLLEVR